MRWTRRGGKESCGTLACATSVSRVRAEVCVRDSRGREGGREGGR
eukprot:COSAG03_NODE_27528_length_252_cov_1.960784_1_plen_44_part_01